MNIFSALFCCDFVKCPSLSGWYCTARRRYLLLISVAFADLETFNAP